MRDGKGRRTPTIHWRSPSSGMLGDVSDQLVLDLGCGDAGFGVELLEKGCIICRNRGFRNSESRFEQSRRSQRNRCTHEARRLYISRDSYDLVLSRLAFIICRISSAFPMHLSELEAKRQVCLLRRASRHYLHASTVRYQNELGGGQLLHRRLPGAMARRYRSQVPSNRRGLFQGDAESRLYRGALRESSPVREHFINETYERRRRIPLFLFLAGEERVTPFHSESTLPPSSGTGCFLSLG